MLKNTKSKSTIWLCREFSDELSGTTSVERRFRISSNQIEYLQNNIHTNWFSNMNSSWKCDFWHTRVLQSMFPEIRRVSERLLADFTRIRLYIWMNQIVPFQRVRIAEFGLAHAASVRFDFWNSRNCSDCANTIRKYRLIDCLTHVAYYMADQFRLFPEIYLTEITDVFMKSRVIFVVGDDGNCCRGIRQSKFW